MCFFPKDKWQKFEPTQNYIDVVSKLDTIEKLHDYMIKNIRYVSDEKDYWQVPEETLIRCAGDCEDFARFAIDVLVRVQKIDNVRWIFYVGYYRVNGKNIRKGHAVCVFPEDEHYNVFSNDSLLKCFDNYVDIGHDFYPFGLKRMEIRNWQGKMIDLRVNYLGTF